MAYGARASVDKVVVIVFPITAFVASGFEHCVANMYFIPVGIFINTFDPGFAVSHNADVANLTLQGFAANLIPVTIGNIIGGVVIVGLAYWYAYLRPAQQA